MFDSLVFFFNISHRIVSIHHLFIMRFSSKHNSEVNIHFILLPTIAITIHNLPLPLFYFPYTHSTRDLWSVFWWKIIRFGGHWQGKRGTSPEKNEQNQILVRNVLEKLTCDWFQPKHMLQIWKYFIPKQKHKSGKFSFLFFL